MTGSELYAPAAEELIRLIPKGFGLVKRWWVGKEVLIIGQPRAGKTTFREYLQYALFDDEKPTDETAEIESTKQIDIGIGQRGNLKLNVKRAIDTPGQVGAVEHANLAFQENPHGLIIVLDLTAPLDGEPDRASATWLKRFCRRYEAKWRVDRNRKNRLKAIVVIMSKADKLASGTIDERRKIYKEILDTELKDARGKMLDGVAVLPCSMVTNPHGTRLMDNVVAYLAAAFSRK